MQLLRWNSLWREIEKLAKSAQYKLAAVAYPTNDDIVKFGEGDLLVVDASQKAISTAQTDRRVLARAFKRGASLYSCPGLHAKVMVFDEELW